MTDSGGFCYRSLVRLLDLVYNYFPYLEETSWVGHCCTYLSCACPPLERINKLYLETRGPRDMALCRLRYWNP